MKKNTKILIGLLILALIGGVIFYGVSDMEVGELRKKINKKETVQEKKVKRIDEKKVYIPYKKDYDEKKDEELKYIQDYQLDQLNSFIEDIIMKPDAYAKRGEFEGDIELKDIIAILMIEEHISSIIINDTLIENFNIDMTNIEDITNINLNEILSMGYVHAAVGYTISDQDFMVPDDSEIISGGQGFGATILLTESNRGETTTVSTTGQPSNGNFDNPKDGDEVVYGTGTNNGENSGDAYVYNEGVWQNSGDNDIDDNGVANGEDIDMDGDGEPNEIDNDDDNDGVFDGADPAPHNPHQGGQSQGANEWGETAPSGGDNNGNGIPNSEDPDIDGDGKLNNEDDDTDGDHIPNDEDEDDDGDGIADADDTSPQGKGSEEDDDDIMAAIPDMPEGQSDDDDDSIPNSYSNLEDLLIFINVEDLESYIFTNEVIGLEILNKIPSYHF